MREVHIGGRDSPAHMLRRAGPRGSRSESTEPTTVFNSILERSSRSPAWTCCRNGPKNTPTGRTRYADFGPTLATEILLEKHDLRVGRETLRRWMVADGLWLSRLGSL